jgi:5'-deoxynucleotidase YfbR-like HD superfamily hydrolase
MIESIDELLKIFKEIESKEQTVINLIYKSDNLSLVVYELKESGYDPRIKYEAGKLTLVSVKLGKVLFMIKTQQLVPDTIDGECSVSSAEFKII